MSDYKPEVGEKVSMVHKGIQHTLIEFMGEKRGKYVFWNFTSENAFAVPVSECKIYPSKTATEKPREQQIGIIASTIADIDFSYPWEAAKKLYEAGCRIVENDEYVVRALTDEQADYIYKSYHPRHHKAVIDAMHAVQRELGIEV